MVQVIYPIWTSCCPFPRTLLRCLSCTQEPEHLTITFLLLNPSHWLSPNLTEPFLISPNHAQRMSPAKLSLPWLTLWCPCSGTALDTSLLASSLSLLRSFHRTLICQSADDLVYSSHSFRQVHWMLFLHPAPSESLSWGWQWSGQSCSILVVRVGGKDLVEVYDTCHPWFIFSAATPLFAC